jgi:hypothetical protein
MLTTYGCRILLIGYIICFLVIKLIYEDQEWAAKLKLIFWIKLYNKEKSGFSRNRAKSLATGKTPTRRNAKPSAGSRRAGQNLRRVFKSRRGRASTQFGLRSTPKRASLKLKARHKQVLGSISLSLAIPG